ncbi:hypothetical protein V6N13_109052 [Hibiscus sabdariffa]|uniref:Uncharacterized protein n=1 Tax=Hibiscus sabdariffa TaxID=183260 RepID=A0ABR2FNH1_9ROSI
MVLLCNLAMRENVQAQGDVPRQPEIGASSNHQPQTNATVRAATNEYTTLQVEKNTSDARVESASKWIENFDAELTDRTELLG